MLIGNYKITVTSALSREQGHLRQIRDLKTRRKACWLVHFDVYAQFEGSKHGTDT